MPLLREGRMTPAEARALFPVLQSRAYLNAGSVGPLSRSTLEAMHATEKLGFERGRGAISAWEASMPVEAELRSRIASLLGVPVE